MSPIFKHTTQEGDHRKSRCAPPHIQQPGLVGFILRRDRQILPTRGRLDSRARPAAPKNTVRGQAASAAEANGPTANAMPIPA